MIFLVAAVSFAVGEFFVTRAFIHEFGFWPFLAWTLLAVGLGFSLARDEGVRVFRRFQSSLATGQQPEEGLVGTVLAVLGGVLIAVPGILSDIIGVLLFVPIVRRVVGSLIGRAFARAAESGTVRFVRFGGGAGFDARGTEIVETDGEIVGETLINVGTRPISGAIIDVDGESPPKILPPPKSP